MPFTGWAIDRDYIEAGRVGTGQTDEELEASGFRNVEIRDDLSAADVADPVRFRVLDDDGEVYYGGAISREWIEGDEGHAFAPLTFATADAGATDLQTHNGDGKWETI